MGRSILLARVSDGSVKAFNNVCLHRQSQIASGCGTARRLSCPYHAWTYDLDGNLVGVPGKEGFPESSSRSAKLTQLPATEYAGFLWLALDQQTSARCEMRQVLAPGTETDDRIVGLSKAIDAAEASDDSWSWLVLRRIHALHHEHEPAQSLLGECLKDARILGLESEIGHLLRHRAWHLKMLSRPDEAEELLRAAVRHEQPGDLFPYWLALTLNELGDTLAAKVLQGGGQDDHRPPSAVPSMPTAKDGRCSSSPSWAAGHQSHR